ncbi:MAG: tetratricopeptide repeat protein [Holophagaceae bacterium]|nr:tetratricopeptide repeat protein [Holophagaceae bacterium]
MRKQSLLLSALLATPILMAQEPTFESLREEGRWKQLRPRIEGWYRAKPEDPYALLWMSRLKLAYGDPPAALDLARKAVAFKSTDAELHIQHGVAARAVLDETDSMLKMLPLSKEWKKALESALAVNPASEEATESLLQFFMGAPAIAGGSNSKAKELAQRFTNIQPSAGLVLQAKAAFRGKDLDGAKSLVQQALAKDPACAKAYSFWITSLKRQKPEPLDTIATLCRKALENHPKAIEFHANLAYSLAKQGKWTELEVCLVQARKIFPDNLAPYFYAGESILDTGSQGRAEPFLRTYLSQSPEGFSPGLASAHANLAYLYDKQGRHSEAIKELEITLSLRPSHKWAQKELQRLKKS